MYSVRWYYVHIKKLSLRAAVVSHQSITASMLWMSDRWICSIIRHSRRFSSHWSSVSSLMCNVNVVSRNKLFCLIYFFSEGIGGVFGHPGHHAGYAPVWLCCRDRTGSPGHGSRGQQFGSGSGRVTGQSPDPAFWPGFLFNVVKNCRQSVSFIIMRYRRHWHVSHKTSSRNFSISVARKPERTDHCPAVVYLFTDPFN